MSFFAKAVSFFTGGWVGYAAIAALLAGAGLWVRHEIVSYGDRREAVVLAEWDLDASERRLAAAGREEDERVRRAKHDADINAERQQRERDGIIVGTVLADTRRQLDRLLTTATTFAAGAVQASNDSAARPGADDPAQRLGAVFGECAGELVSVAEQTEQLAIQVRGLQAYATSALGVCGVTPP